LRDWATYEPTAAPGVVRRQLVQITTADRSAFLVTISGYGALAQTLDLSALDEAAEHMTLVETFVPW